MRRGVVLTIVLFGLGAGSAQAGWMVNGSPLKTSKQVVGWGQIVLKVNETAFVAPYKETHEYTMSPMGEVVCRTVSASSISGTVQTPELWAAYNCESTVGACSLGDTEGQQSLPAGTLEGKVLNRTGDYIESCFGPWRALSGQMFKAEVLNGSSALHPTYFGYAAQVEHCPNGLVCPQEYPPTYVASVEGGEKVVGANGQELIGVNP